MSGKLGSPQPPKDGQALPTVTDILAAANMRRLLDAYRSLAPLTIGGPSSTSLETPGTPLSTRPPPDPRILRKFAHYPWAMAGPVFPLPGAVPGPGPGAVLQGREERRRHHSDGIPPPSPVFSAKDKDSSSLRETLLDGQKISCFNVGGEDRLCLTQLLQLVLHDLPLARIHQACDELQIFCSTCSPTQLAKLKLARVLPISAAQCGLITKSDAERLCSLLLQEPLSQKPTGSGGSPPPPSSPAVSPPRTVDPTSFRVLHRCFGECVGLLHPGSCTGPAARCIECTECQAFLSPQKFVSHSHQQQETRTCHWGFDSQNWPAYIQVCEDYSEDEGDKHREDLAAIKKRFQLNKAKRKWAEADTDEVKRSRQEDDPEVGVGFRGYEPPPGLPGPSLRHSSEMSNSPFPDPQPAPHNQVFLNNMGFPFPQPEKVGFPPFDPRPFYLQWASNPLANPYLQNMRPPCPPAPYLHSLAQFHNLKALATKTILEQQNLAKTLLQASIHSPPNYEALLKKQKSSEVSESGQCGSGGGAVAPPTAHAPVPPEEGPAISEFVVSVSAVLETTGVDHASKARVMGVVNRLVDRLHRVEEEKDSATLQLKAFAGMEERMCRLEKELEDRNVTKEDSVEQPSYESSRKQQT